MARAARARRAAVAAPVDRRDVLDAASRILSEEGLRALTMRRVAHDAKTSTMVLYSRFGSREGLLEALLVEGFTRFGDALGAVQARDAWKNLRLLGRAYRRFARENPTYYRLMWSERAQACNAQKPVSDALLQAGNRSFGALVQAVTRVLALLDRPAREVEPLALSVWSTVHGFVSLEQSGAIPPGPAAEAAYERTLQFVEDALRRP